MNDETKRTISGYFLDNLPTIAIACFLGYNALINADREIQASLDQMNAKLTAVSKKLNSNARTMGCVVRTLDKVVDKTDVRPSCKLTMIND